VKGLSVNYSTLTDAQKTQILRQKLLEVEAEHFGLNKNVELANAAGISNQQVEEAHSQIRMLETQMRILREDLGIKDVEDDDEDIFLEPPPKKHIERNRS
jgi:hypothetical protein